MFKKIKEVQDIVSLLVFCQEDNTVYFTINSAGDLRFPSIPVKDTCWSKTVADLIKDVCGQEMGGEKFTRLIKVWVGGENENWTVNHIIYSITVPLDIKKKIVADKAAEQHGKRMSLATTNWKRIQDMDKLWIDGPVCADMKPLLSPLERSMTPTRQDNSCPAMRRDGAVIEVLKEHVLGRVMQASCEEAIAISSSGWNSFLKQIYKDFLLETFPHTVMSFPTFQRYIRNFNWSLEVGANLFRAIDLTQRGGISAREFIYFICMTDPSIQADSPEYIEERLRFIFRYLDSNNDSKMEPLEFRSFINLLGEADPASWRSNDKERLLDRAYKEVQLTIGNAVSLSAFLRITKNTKFALMVSSRVLKSSVTIRNYLTSVSKKSQLEEPTNASGDTSGSVSADGDSPIRVYRDYNLAGHAIKLSKKGITDIHTFDKIEGATTASSLRLLTGLVKKPSKNTFDMTTPANELLLGLDFFASAVSQESSMDARAAGGSFKPKAAFEWGNVNYGGFARCLISVCQNVMNIFKDEPRLILINSPICVVGDIHGNYPDLYTMERLLWPVGPHLTLGSFLFLGDYVDRGSMGVEVIAYLLAQKLKSPDKIFLIRGNHETRSIQKVFTFYRECIKKMGAERGEVVWESINKVFDCLPLAALIDGKVFCCHGGIPPPWLCPNISVINKIPVPLAKPEEESALAWDLLWNDPVKPDIMDPPLQQELNANEGFAVNKRRGTAHVFTAAALQKFLLANGLSYVIRGHEAQNYGYQLQHRGKLLTVFSSSYYMGTNEAAVILIYNNRIRVVRLDTQEFHTAV